MKEIYACNDADYYIQSAIRVIFTRDHYLQYMIHKRPSAGTDRPFVIYGILLSSFCLKIRTLAADSETAKTPDNFTAIA